MLDIPFLVRDLVFFLLTALTVILITRRLAVPYTLGLVVVGLLFSLFGILPEAQLSPPLVLFVFLPALLFEGAWSTKLSLLRENWQAIFLLVGPGMLLSLVLIACILYFFGGLDWATAFLLAAILSPTDPVAVLSLFRQLHVNEQLSTIIEGESLFNDGVAGSLYQTFLAVVLLSLHEHVSAGVQGWIEGAGLFALAAGGGILLGGVCGWGVSWLVRHIDDPLIETTITIIVAYGVYLLADTLHLSAILAVIVAGLVLGGYGRAVGMSEQTRAAVDTFWSTLAFVANALIFLLVGIQLNPLALLSNPATSEPTLLVALLAIGAVLLARLVLVFLLATRSRGKSFPAPIPHSWSLVIFWSGLRGALSLVLVLAIPLEVPNRWVLVISTYSVVFFTLLIQGFSLRGILKRLPGVSESHQSHQEMRSPLSNNV
jgi:CPA1 family monovalent cation:H+ antiporter